MIDLLKAFATAVHERALLFDAMREMKEIEKRWISRE